MLSMSYTTLCTRVGNSADVEPATYIKELVIILLELCCIRQLKLPTDKRNVRIYGVYNHNGKQRCDIAVSVDLCC